MLGDYSIEFDTLNELLDIIKEMAEKENMINIHIEKTDNGYSAVIQSNSFDGTEGQDRENYIDVQDRKFYTTD